MARQSGKHTITGTIDNLCFYKMEGKFYVRRKSSLTGKRVKKDAAFTHTMRYAALLGEASKMASFIYKQLPAEEKIKGLYRRITGEAMQLLKAGNDTTQVLQQLQAIYLIQPLKRQAVKVKRVAVAPDLFALLLLQTIFTDCMPATEMVVTKDHRCDSS